LALSSLLPALHQPRHAAGPNGSIGLAWQMLERSDGIKVIFKDGAAPGYSTFIIFTPSTASGAVILSNHRECPVQRMGGQIISVLNGHGELPFEPPLLDREP
jgi:hypothetical protein